MMRLCMAMYVCVGEGRKKESAGKGGGCVGTYVVQKRAHVPLRTDRVRSSSGSSGGGGLCRAEVTRRGGDGDDRTN